MLEILAERLERALQNHLDENVVLDREDVETILRMIRRAIEMKLANKKPPEGYELAQETVPEAIPLSDEPRPFTPKKPSKTSKGKKVVSDDDAFIAAVDAALYERELLRRKDRAKKEK